MVDAAFHNISSSNGYVAMDLFANFLVETAGYMLVAVGNNDDAGDDEYFESPSSSMFPSRFLNEKNKTRTSFLDFARNFTKGANETDDDWNPEGLTDGQIIESTLKIYGSLFVVGVLAVCILRRAFPRAYNLRSGWNSLPINPRATGNAMGRFSWLYKVWLVSDIELCDDCGMDALCLIRVLEWGARLSLFGSLVGCVILMPVYATAGGIYTGTHGVEQLNTSNVPEGGHRFLVTVLGAYVIFGYAMHSMLQEFEWFYNYRYQFLKKPLPRNYTVYVRNLSEEHLSKKALVDYFSNLEDHRYNNHDGNDFSGGDDKEETVALVIAAAAAAKKKGPSNNKTKAWVALKIPKLRQLVAKRTAVLAKLEHAINIEDQLGKIPKTKDENGLIITVVDALFLALKDLNTQIATAITKIDRRADLADPDEYDAKDYRNPLLLEGSEDFRPSPDAFFDTQTFEAPTLQDQGTLSTNWKEPTMVPLEEHQEHQNEGDFDEELTMNTESDQLSATAGRSDNNDDKIINRKLYEQTTSLVDQVGKVAMSSVEVTKQAVDQVGKVAKTGVEVVGTQVERVASLVLNKEDDGAPMTAGFVTFSTLTACQAAKQMVHSKDVFGMEVLEGPGVDDVKWANVGKTHAELQFGMLLSISLTTTLCFFWTIIVAFISGLSSVDGLTGLLPGLGEALVKYPWLKPVLDQLSPLMLVVANVLLKVLLEALSGLEGHISCSLVEASLFSKLSAFNIIQTFLVNALSGSIIAQLSMIVQNPSSIVQLLADSLPNQSSFFITFILVQTSVILTTELLRVSPIGIAIARSLLGPKLTEDERRTTWMGLRPLANPLPYQHAEGLASAVLLFIVFFVYATLAPITSIFAFLCFVCAGIALRHQFIFVYPTVPDSGGKLWIQFMQIVPVSLLIAEFTIVGLLALKQVAVASSAMIPLVIITVLFNVYIRQKHFSATDFLPGIDCVEADRKNNLDGPMDMRFISNQYKQPELRDKTLWPSNASLERQVQHGMMSSDPEAVGLHTFR